MKLSVIILNYNAHFFLDLCLKSVQRATQAIDAEIIVVDNNSSDQSMQHIKANYPKAKCIFNTKNVGFSKGNNLGIKEAKGKYICILNPDTVVAEDCFTSLIDFASKTEQLGLVGCQLIDGSGSFLPESKRHIPNIKIALNKFIGRSKWYYNNTVNSNEINKTPVLVGAFMFGKKEIFNLVKGFDEDYFMYGEDIDLSYRVLKKGYNNYYLGNIVAIHFKGESTPNDTIYAKRFYEAMSIFHKKHFYKNSLYNAVIRLGTLVAYSFRKDKKKNFKKVANYILMSNKTYSQLDKKLNQKLEKVEQLDTVSDYTQIIFDANFLTYKTIIQLIKKYGINNTISFKILPHNANYIIGSSDSLSHGEVVIF